MIYRNTYIYIYISLSLAKEIYLRNPKLQGFLCLVCLVGDLKTFLPQVLLKHRMQTLSVQPTNAKHSRFIPLVSLAQKVLEMVTMVEIGFIAVQGFQRRRWIWTPKPLKGAVRGSHHPKHHHHCLHLVRVRVWSQRRP